MQCTAAVVLLVGVATAVQPTVTLEPARDVRQFDGWIYVLMDSAVCETCVTTDSRGVQHRVWTDSGRVMYQNNLVSSTIGAGCPSNSGQDWTQAIRLSAGRNCSSPIVFERLDTGVEPLLVAMWREEFDGRFEVMCRYRLADVAPYMWGRTLNVTIRQE